MTWDKKLNNRHDLLAGAAVRYTYYDDNTPATRMGDDSTGINQADQFYLPGVFVQDEITLSKQTRLLLGARYDYHSRHGNIFTPRINLKMVAQPQQHPAFERGQRGFRVVNLFTRSRGRHGSPAGSDPENLRPERSWNANLNYQKLINIGNTLLSLDGTAFYTYFTNKIVADYQTNANQIIYENLAGHAVSRGFTFNADAVFTFPLKVNAGFTLMDVYQAEQDPAGEWQKNRQLLTENFSGAFALSYTFEKQRITVDYTGNVYGPMLLPVLGELDNRAPVSRTYSLQNIQLTKIFSNGIEVYGGVKNLLNFYPAGQFHCPSV